jgi:hypothetical protein
MVLVAAGLGCLRQQPAPLPPPPVPLPAVSPWPGILARAQRLADGGRFAEADRLLGEFAVSQPGTADGAEADFWRALFKADPLNRDVPVYEQLAAFDAYLHGGPSLPRYAEAQIMRRLIEVADSTTALVVAVRASAEARDRAKNEEVKRLAEEVEKTVAELERIRRRLAPKADDKKPPPPGHRSYRSEVRGQRP